jgi:hypothetical protein
MEKFWNKYIKHTLGKSIENREQKINKNGDI